MTDSFLCPYRLLPSVDFIGVCATDKAGVGAVDCQREPNLDVIFEEPILLAFFEGLGFCLLIFDRAKVKPFKDLRAVFSAHPEPFQIIARKGSKIKDWNSLKGKKVNIGNPGSGQRGTFEVLMESHGVNSSYFGSTSELTSSEQSGALCDKKIDAYGYTVGVPNAGVAQATDGCKAYIINLTTPQVKKLVADNPFYAFATIPKGTYKTSKKDVTTFGVMASVVTSAKVSDDMVYNVVRAVFENLDDFKKQHPAFANLDPKKMIKDGLSAPLHPGAVRYYKEKGLM